MANTKIDFRYNSLAAAEHNHADDDHTLVTVTCEIPAVLEGEPAANGLPFLETINQEDEIFPVDQGLWIATGKSAFHKVGGAPGAPIAHYIDANSIEGLIAPSEIIAETKPEALADLARCWAEGIGDNARQIYIDREGQIRERINF